MKLLFKLCKRFRTGGLIEIIDGYERKSDHIDLLSIARCFANKGNHVQITTDIHFKDEKYQTIFGSLNGTKYERKCPDLIINGKFYEYESFEPPFSKRKLSNMVSHGTKQSKRIIINNNKGASDRYIKLNIVKRLSDKSFKYNIEEIWLYEKGKVRQIW